MTVRNRGAYGPERLTFDEVDCLGKLIQRLQDNEQLGKFGLRYGEEGVNLNCDPALNLISQAEMRLLRQLLDTSNTRIARPIRSPNGGP